MRLDSVRDLKSSLPGILINRFSDLGLEAAGDFSLGVARAASPSSAVPSYALGVSAGRKKNDYRLAVRIQHRTLMGSELVTAIRDAARGEADVRYIGRVTAGAKKKAKKLAAAKPWYRSRQRPLSIGASCGYLRVDLIMAGTLGCFVRRKSGGPAMILSNNHVLADEGRYPKGGPIVQPGALDGGRLASDRVAELTSFVKFRKVPKVNYVDAAVAAIDAGVDGEPSKLRGVGTLLGPAPAPLDIREDVHKVGRTTGARQGRVTAIELDGVSVEYDTGVFVFDNQIEIEGAGNRSFSDAGDSGSLVVDAELRGAALLFAGSEQGGSNDRGLTYANPLRAVLSRMRLELLF
jgi:hypothetical protein